jgi:hypothetical protein
MIGKNSKNIFFAGALHLVTLWRRGHSQNLQAPLPGAATYFRNTLLLGHYLTDTWLAAFVGLSYSYHITFAVLTLIVLFVEMLKSSKNIVFSEEQNYMRKNKESFRIFKFSTWNIQNKLKIWQKCVEAGPVLWSQIKQNEIPHSLPHKYICLASVAHSGPS